MLRSSGLSRFPTSTLKLDASFIPISPSRSQKLTIYISETLRLTLFFNKKKI